MELIKFFFIVTRMGCFFVNIVKGIGDKVTSYDDVQERRELEYAAKTLFG